MASTRRGKGIQQEWSDKGYGDCDEQGRKEGGRTVDTGVRLW